MKTYFEVDFDEFLSQMHRGEQCTVKIYIEVVYSRKSLQCASIFISRKTDQCYWYWDFFFHCFKGFLKYKIFKEWRKSAFAPNVWPTLLNLFHQRHTEHEKTLKKVQPESETRQVFFCIIIAIILWNCRHVVHSAAFFQWCASLGKNAFNIHHEYIECKLPSFWCWKRCASLTIRKFIPNNGEVDEMREKGRGPLKVVAEAALCILRLMRAKLKFMIYFADWKATKFPSKNVVPF